MIKTTMKPMLIVILFSLPISLNAQTRAGIPANDRYAEQADSLLVPMHIIAQNDGDSIVVRWAPGNPVVWLLSQKEGFMFRRRVFKKNDHHVFTLVDSSSVLIHPWTLNAWASYFKSSHDSLSAIAAQVLYGKTIAFDKGKQGNSLNTIFEKYNEQENRYGFALLLADFDPAVAEGLGLRFVDTAVQKELYYLYTVRPAGTHPDMRSDTGKVWVDGAAIYHRKKFPAVTSLAADQRIHLFWPADNLANPYSGYIIERSEDGTNFTRLNRLPYISFNKVKDPRKPVEYSDSVMNYKKYYYRVSGINAFGDQSYPSAVISAMAVDLTPPAPPLITTIKNTGTAGEIYFHWDKKNREADFKGYVVGRSMNLKGPFEPISKDLLPFDTHDFTDAHPNAHAPNYYIVAAVDTAGNAGRSMPVYRNGEDHMPPAQPTGLTGSIDSIGKVFIHWNWGQEDDLAGYEIFFSNAAKDVFTPLSQGLLTDTLFTDSITLKTLTKKIFYKVIAYDRVMNASPASAVLVLSRPDKIAPIAAVIHAFHVSDSGVVINWHPSASEDAALQQLYRQADSTMEWKLLATLSALDTTFMDQEILPRHTYSYTIETLDSSRLRSGKSFPLRVYVYDKGYTERIKDFEVRQGQDKSEVVLKWSPPEGEVSYYILFKGKDNKGLKMAGNIAGNSVSYEERIGGGNYQYAVKAVHPDGKTSALSEIKSISIP